MQKDDKSGSYMATNLWQREWGTRISNLVFTDTGTNSGKGTKAVTEIIDERTANKLAERNPKGFWRVGGHIIGQNTGTTFLQELRGTHNQEEFHLITRSNITQLQYSQSVRQTSSLSPSKQNTRRAIENFQLELGEIAQTFDYSATSPELTRVRGFNKMPAQEQAEAFAHFINKLPKLSPSGADSKSAHDRADVDSYSNALLPQRNTARARHQLSASLEERLLQAELQQRQNTLQTLQQKLRNIGKEPSAFEKIMVPIWEKEVTGLQENINKLSQFISIPPQLSDEVGGSSRSTRLTGTSGATASIGKAAVSSKPKQ